MTALAVQAAEKGATKVISEIPLIGDKIAPAAQALLDKKIAVMAIDMFQCGVRETRAMLDGRFDALDRITESFR